MGNCANDIFCLSPMLSYCESKISEVRKRQNVAENFQKLANPVHQFCLCQTSKILDSQYESNGERQKMSLAQLLIK